MTQIPTPPSVQIKLPFVSRKGFPLSKGQDGPLANLRVAVKDLFAIAGMPTGAGNPDWLRTHAPANTTAPVLERLMDAGAALAGKTLTDELAYSLTGDNIHYGTPLNGAAADRLPGGSSSGSASAVSLGLADVGLGTDTGGSIRIPSLFCGLFGLRPSHGAIAAKGLTPLAPGFDTIGWMARDAETLNAVGDVLLPERAVPSFDRLLVAEPMFAMLADDRRAALLPALGALGDLWQAAATIDGPGEEDLAEAAEWFRVLQAREAWQIHGDWITKTNPTFAPGIAERFAQASRISPEEARIAAAGAQEFRRRICDILGERTLLAIPTGPDIAPLRSAGDDTLGAFRQAAIKMTCLAGLCGLPQVHIPCATVAGAPFGLSLVASAGADRALLAALRETVVPALALSQTTMPTPTHPHAAR